MGTVRVSGLFLFEPPFSVRFRVSGLGLKGSIRASIRA